MPVIIAQDSALGSYSERAFHDLVACRSKFVTMADTAAGHKKRWPAPLGCTSFLRDKPLAAYGGEFVTRQKAAWDAAAAHGAAPQHYDHCNMPLAPDVV